jgi:hypothetical protein
MLPSAIAAPLAEIVVNHATWRQIVREHAPGTPTADDVQDSVDYCTFGIRFGPAARFGHRHKRCKEGPLCITEVGGIGFSLFHVGILPSWTSLV